MQDDTESIKTLSGPEAIVKSLLICEKKILRDALAYLNARVQK